MKESLTSKLYYGRYAYIVLIKHNKEDITDLSKWLDKKNIEHKLWSKPKHKKYYTSYGYRYPRRGHLTNKRLMLTKIFLRTNDDFDKVCKKYKSKIESVTKPHDENHEDTLKSMMNIVYRDTLIYKKYRYIVTLKNAGANGASKWLTQFIDDAPADSPRKLKRSWYSRIKLYLSTEEDMVMLKLTWMEKIKHIDVIHTFDELKTPSIVESEEVVTDSIIDPPII